MADDLYEKCTRNAIGQGNKKITPERARKLKQISRAVIFFKSTQVPLFLLFLREFFLLPFIFAATNS